MNEVGRRPCCPSALYVLLDNLSSWPCLQDPVGSAKKERIEETTVQPQNVLACMHLFILSEKS